MTDYDLWISTNPAEKQQEIDERNFERFLDKEDDLESLAYKPGWDAQDVLNYVSQFHNDYEKAILEFKEEYYSDLLGYFQNHEV